MLVFVIVLNLTEIPVIGVQYADEVLGVTMEGKADIPNGALSAFCAGTVVCHNPNRSHVT